MGSYDFRYTDGMTDEEFEKNVIRPNVGRGGISKTARLAMEYREAYKKRKASEQQGPRTGPSGGTALELPSWVGQAPPQGAPPQGAPPQGVPQLPPQTTTAPLKQLALHKRAPKSESQALSQALRQGG